MTAAIVTKPTLWIVIFPSSIRGDAQERCDLVESGSELRSQSPPTAKANLPHPAERVGVRARKSAPAAQGRCLGSYVRNVDPVPDLAACPRLRRLRNIQISRTIRQSARPPAADQNARYAAWTALLPGNTGPPATARGAAAGPRGPGGRLARDGHLAPGGRPGTGDSRRMPCRRARAVPRGKAARYATNRNLRAAGSRPASHGCRTVATSRCRSGCPGGPDGHRSSGRRARAHRALRRRMARSGCSGCPPQIGRGCRCGPGGLPCRSALAVRGPR
jgi:hypothetical protein